MNVFVNCSKVRNSFVGWKPVELATPTGTLHDETLRANPLKHTICKVIHA